MAGDRDAAIVGFVELPASRRATDPTRFTLEQYALLARAALDDAGLSARDVDGIVSGSITESEAFVPSTIAEYLGIPVNFGEVVDLGGASSAGMVWRAAAAVRLGLCEAVLCVAPGGPSPRSSRRAAKGPELRAGASSNRFGSPQAEFEIPYGILGQNAPYAQMARRYGHEFGWDARALAKIAVDQRVNANHTPGAVFHDRPITVDDVLASPMVADPIHMLEIVMPCVGGAAVVVTSADVARRSSNRPVWIRGFGERIEYKSPAFATDLMRSPITQAAETAFAMAGVGRADVDLVSIYDCYTITVLMTLEDAGFCRKGEGLDFVRNHDLTFRGDFPVNTAGGQLGYGQCGYAGGMHHVVDAVRQIMRRAGKAQVDAANRAFVTGNGGIMSEQVALVLEGD